MNWCLSQLHDSDHTPLHCGRWWSPRVSTPARTDSLWAVFIQVDLNDGSTMRLSFETCVNMPMSYEKYAHKRSSQAHVCICICTHFDIQHAYIRIWDCWRFHWYCDIVILFFWCIQCDDDPISCVTSIFWGFFGSIEGHGDSRYPQIHWSTASRWCPLKDEIGPRIFNFDPWKKPAVSGEIRWTSPIAYIRLKPLDVPVIFSPPF